MFFPGQSFVNIDTEANIIFSSGYWNVFNENIGLADNLCLLLYADPMNIYLDFVG